MADGKTEKTDEYVLLRSDRRESLRAQILVLKVTGRDRQGVFFGYAKTIGRGGMFISSVNPRKAGEEFDISFTLPGVPGEMTCRCVVAWVREYDPKLSQEPGMGLKFTGISEDVQEAIGAWVLKNKG